MTKLKQVLLNVPVSDRDNAIHHSRIQQVVKDGEIKLAGQGRILLRPSGTEPVVRIMVEGEDAILVESVANEIATVVAETAKN